MSKKRKYKIRIAEVAVVLATILFSISTYYDFKVQEVNNKIESYERDSLFNINKFLIKGILYNLNKTSYNFYLNTTFYVSDKSMTFNDAINYLLSKDIKFSEDLINQNVYYPERQRYLKYKNAYFWASLWVFLAAILFFLDKDNY